MIVISKIFSYFLTSNNVGRHDVRFSTKLINIWNNIVSYLLPIKRSELSKFLCITLLMFCILFIQNLIRALKDSIINTMIGTETVAFLKFWGVLPAAFLFAMLYVTLVNIIKGENIFYFILSIFLLFFALFAFYIFPNHTLLHLDSRHADFLIKSYPNFKWFILLLSNWSFSLFYIIAELWPNIVFALLFWQFVNSVTNVEQSTRFYPLFGLFGQTNLYISGKCLSNLDHLNKYFIDKFDLKITENVLLVQIILSIVLILGVVALATFWILNHKILAKDQAKYLQFVVKKQAITIVESFKMAIYSRYIRLIATLLICYGIAINLVEGPWKSLASKTYKTPTEFAVFIGNYQMYTGIFTILFVALCSNIVRSFGWVTAAMVTPVIVFITGILFFAVTNLKELDALWMISLALTDPVLMAIVIGSIQNILSKSSKYAFFDATKEMSYVPLDDELKTKGKAAADVIGTKLGKSAGSLIQSLIFIILPMATYQSISNYLMAIFAVICVIWIWAVRELGKEYEIITLKNNSLSLDQL